MNYMDKFPSRQIESWQIDWSTGSSIHGKSGIPKVRGWNKSMVVWEAFDGHMFLPWQSTAAGKSGFALHSIRQPGLKQLFRLAIHMNVKLIMHIMNQLIITYTFENKWSTSMFDDLKYVILSNMSCKDLLAWEWLAMRAGFCFARHRSFIPFRYTEVASQDIMEVRWWWLWQEGLIDMVD